MPNVNMKTTRNTKPDQPLTLAADPMNPNRMTPEDKARMAKSLPEFGDLGCIILNRRTGTLIGGHQRTDVMKGATIETTDLPEPEPDGTVARGWLVYQGRKFALRVVDWIESKAKAAMVAANRFGRVGQDDAAMLKDLLQELDTGEMDMDLTGFDAGELERLMLQEHQDGEADAEPQIDRAEELNERWAVKPGDLWLIGEHRLLCGDSTSAADAGLLMGGEKAALCLTDPPYGLGDTASVKNEYNTHADTVENLKHLIDEALPLAIDAAGVVVLTPGNGNHRLYPSPTWTMAWFTPAGVGSGPWGFCCWQPILCYGKDPKLSKGKGRHPDAIVHTEGSEKLGHPCSKPIRFWQWLMERTSEQGALCYDPFLGSGTTMVAGENLGRKVYGLEISPAYCAVILERMITAFPEIDIRKG